MRMKSMSMVEATPPGWTWYIICGVNLLEGILDSIVPQSEKLIPSETLLSTRKRVEVAVGISIMSSAKLEVEMVCPAQVEEVMVPPLETNARQVEVPVLVDTKLLKEIVVLGACKVIASFSTPAP